MAEIMFVFCDVCNPKRSISRDRHGRGYAEMSFEEARDLDWIERNGQHVCCQCRENEEDNLFLSGHTELREVAGIYLRSGGRVARRLGKETIDALNRCQGGGKASGCVVGSDI